MVTHYVGVSVIEGGGGGGAWNRVGRSEVEWGRLGWMG